MWPSSAVTTLYRITLPGHFFVTSEMRKMQSLSEKMLLEHEQGENRQTTRILH